MATRKKQPHPQPTEPPHRAPRVSATPPPGPWLLFASGAMIGSGLYTRLGATATSPHSKQNLAASSNGVPHLWQVFGASAGSSPSGDFRSVVRLFVGSLSERLSPHSEQNRWASAVRAPQVGHEVNFATTQPHRLPTYRKPHLPIGCERGLDSNEVQ